MNKRGDFMHKYLFEIILSAVLLLLFLFATLEKVDSRDVKQQVLEKQIALLLESADSGMTFRVDTFFPGTVINRIRVERGRVFVDVDSLVSVRGYPYFSKHSVVVTKTIDHYIIEVVDNG